METGNASMSGGGGWVLHHIPSLWPVHWVVLLSLASGGECVCVWFYHNPRRWSHPSDMIIRLIQPTLVFMWEIKGRESRRSFCSFLPIYLGVRWAGTLLPTRTRLLVMSTELKTKLFLSSTDSYGNSIATETQLLKTKKTKNKKTNHQAVLFISLI